MADDAWSRMKARIKTQLASKGVVVITPPAPEPVKKTRIKLPVFKPMPVIRVPPFPLAKHGPRQVTVLDHEDNGNPYVRNYVERYAMGPDDPYYTDSRNTTLVFCKSKLHHDIALVACHHYCKSPCVDHMAKLAEKGWSGSPIAPPSERGTTRKRNVTKEDDDE